MASKKKAITTSQESKAKIITSTESREKQSTILVAKAMINKSREVRTS